LTLWVRLARLSLPGLAGRSRFSLCCSERQVPPDIVQFPARTSGPRVAFATEQVNIPKWVWSPVSRASPRSPGVIRVVELKEVNGTGDVSPGLIGVYGTLPPNPLAGAQLIFPDVVEEAGRL